MKKTYIIIYEEEWSTKTLRHYEVEIESRRKAIALHKKIMPSKKIVAIRPYGNGLYL